MNCLYLYIQGISHVVYFLIETDSASMHLTFISVNKSHLKRETVLSMSSTSRLHQYLSIEGIDFLVVWKTELPKEARVQVDNEQESGATVTTIRIYLDLINISVTQSNLTMWIPFDWDLRMTSRSVIQQRAGYYPVAQTEAVGWLGEPYPSLPPSCLTYKETGLSEDHVTWWLFALFINTLGA